MWWLISLHNEDVRYGILAGKQYIVGRKDGDIIVPEDQSMSRKHAILKVIHSENNITQLQSLPELQLQDTSKLGTMLQDVRFRADTKNLKDGQQILFGTGGESKFRASYEPCVVTTSCLETAAKRSIRPQIARLGGHLVSEWRKSCSLLIMSNLSVTIKVICALVSQKQIVTPNYLDDVVAAVESKAKPPSPKDYLPPLAESQVNPSEVSFEQNPSRKTLFQGKIFIFLNPKQFKKLSIAVELADGTPMLMEEGSDDGDDLLTSPNSCVMHSDPESAQSQIAMHWTERVNETLAKKGLRTIQDSELGYAVLYASTDRYCNPTKDPENAIGRAPPMQSMSQIPMPSQGQIKQEVASQAAAAQGTPKRKRGQSEPEADDTPSAKTRRTAPSSVIEIKPEPISQRQSMTPARTSRKRSPAPPSPEPRRSSRKSPAPPSPEPRRSSRRSPAPPSPEPGQKKNVRSPTSSSRRQPSPGPSTSSKDGESPVKSRRKKSPAPEKRQPAVTKAIEAKRPARKGQGEIKDEFDAFDFDSVPTRKKRRRGGGDEREDSDCQDLFTESAVDTKTEVEDFDNISSRRAKRRHTEPEIVSNQKSPSPVRKAEVVADVDEFDQIPSRRGRKAEPKHDVIEDEFDDIPSRRIRKNRQEKGEVVEIEDDEFGEISSKRKRSVKVEADETDDAGRFGQGESEAIVPDEFDMVPSRRKGRKSVKESPKKSPKREQNAVINTDEDRAAPGRSRPSTLSVVAEPVDSGDFINCRSHNGALMKPPHADSVLENGADDSIKGGTVVVEESLVARKPGYRDMEKKKTAADCNEWQGRKMKNFKCFKKSGKSVMSLPRIIGGSDLIVHDNKSRKELEEWFKETSQAEALQSQETREASSLFDWVPPKKAGRR